MEFLNILQMHGDGNKMEHLNDLTKEIFGLDNKAWIYLNEKINKSHLEKLLDKLCPNYTLIKKIERYEQNIF